MSGTGFTSQEEWSKEYPIVFVCRRDLESVGLTTEQIDGLTDNEMQEIASMMADIYLDNGYWEDLQLCVSRFLKADEDESSNGEEPDDSSNTIELCPIKKTTGGAT